MDSREGREPGGVNSPEQLEELLKFPEFDLSYADHDFAIDVARAQSDVDNGYEAAISSNSVLAAHLIEDESSQRILRRSGAKSARCAEVADWIRRGGFKKPPEEIRQYLLSLDRTSASFMNTVILANRDSNKGAESSYHKLAVIDNWNEMFAAQWNQIFPDQSSVNHLIRLSDIESPAGIETYVARAKDSDLEYDYVFEVESPQSGQDTASVVAYMGSLVRIGGETMDDEMLGKYYFTVDKQENLELTALQVAMVKLAIKRYEYYARFFQAVKSGNREMLTDAGEDIAALSEGLDEFSDIDLDLAVAEIRTGVEGRDRLLEITSPEFMLIRTLFASE